MTECRDREKSSKVHGRVPLAQKSKSTEDEHRWAIGGMAHVDVSLPIRLVPKIRDLRIVGQ